MTLQSEDMGKLVAGKSVIAKNHNLRTVADVRGNRVWVWGCQGQNHFLVEDIEAYTFIGTLTPDGWIEGEWAENPVGDLVIEVLTRGQAEQGITVKDARRAGSFLWGMRSDGRLKDTDIIAFRPAHREAQPETDGGGEDLTCQSCGGEIQGWTCQGCGATFRENDAGVLVRAIPEGQTEGAVEPEVRKVLSWFAGEIGAAERGKATTRKARKLHLIGEATNMIAALASKGV